MTEGRVVGERSLRSTRFIEITLLVGAICFGASLVFGALLRTTGQPVATATVVIDGLATLALMITWTLLRQRRFARSRT